MMLKFFFLPIIVLTSLVQQENELQLLLKLWHQVPEEQIGDTLVFRPDGYELPRVRGREKMQFRPDGEFIYHQIAPEDGYNNWHGVFKLGNNESEIQVIYTKHKTKILTDYKIIELNKNVLKMILLKFEIKEQDQAP